MLWCGFFVDKSARACDAALSTARTLVTSWSAVTLWTVRCSRAAGVDHSSEFHPEAGESSVCSLASSVFFFFFRGWCPTEYSCTQIQIQICKCASV